MRIDMVTPRFPPSLGGIEESTRQLSVGLVQRGHDLTVHTIRLGDAPLRERIDGVEVRRYALVMDRGFYVSRFEPRLDGDVIHLHAYAHQTNDWVIAQHADKTPTFLSTHHGARFPKPHLPQKVYHAWYNRARGFPNLRKLEGVIVPTGYDATFFAEKGVPTDQIHVIPSGADEQAFGRNPPWAPPGVDPGFILYVGRFDREKGIADLLDAHEIMPGRPPLVLAGKDEGALKGRDREALRAENVHVVEPLSEDKRWRLLAACGVLVLPSHHEGQGIVIAEAWAQRKPVVATRVGGVPSVVDDGVEGILVDPKDPDALAQALQRVLRDEVLARRLGEAGRKKAVEQYRWPALVDRVERLYRESLAKTRLA
jgi:glycogen synthase